MENNVPYIVHESILARMERSNRRLFIVVLVLIAVLAASWIGFFVYESQFDAVSVSQDVDTGEDDAIVAGVGDVNYGPSETDD